MTLESHRPFIEDLYRELHASPELSNREHRSAARMAELLRGLGFEVHEQVGEATGVVGILRRGEGPTVLVRADMDALPVTEAEQVPYRSTVTDQLDGQTVGVMHACGHDTHMAGLQGALHVLVDQDDWSGTIVAVFQPAEEVMQGAAGMQDALRELLPGGIDVALGQHVMPGAAGEVQTAAGPIMAASDHFIVTVRGRGGHGSQPEKTIDPIVLAASMVLRLQTIVSREVAPAERAVLTIGTFHAGNKQNIIPDQARFEINIRTFEPAVRQRMIAAIERIVQGECQVAGAPPALIETGDIAPLTINDADAAARVGAAFDAEFGEAHVPSPQYLGSEDFSYLPAVWGAPYVFWMYGGFDPQLVAEARERGTFDQDVPSNHAPNFIPVLQPTLDTATRAMVAAVRAFLA
ncbi:amidohydrolase [Agrococcus carbonis]|uniref:Hippurate hydrolase n=1 Tax=Agrococcus carbonis TaxID=684552 RepID=A0A1H1PHG2_9MICO|nr:amidohydrolase [Agrococcus carbonis]SDS10465.1 hippurate hydrolase [Agrococcus carbonis]